MTAPASTRVVVLASGRVLVEALRRPLEAAGYEVAVFSALAPLVDDLDRREPRPRAVLVGRRIGAEDGLRALERLAAHPALAGAARVLVSGDEADRDAAARLRAELLRLPFGDGDLLGVVGALCRDKRLILLADDSQLIHRHTVPILEEAGYEVLSAYDGAAALELAAQRRPDLCVTDVEMPRLDGYELCKALKQRPGAVPVIICSAHGDAHDLERGFDAGADDYLVKPAAPNELLARIRDLLSVASVGLGVGLRERILVADDSPAIRHLIADALTRQGFSVTTAEDGQEALERARAGSFDLLITDYDMPRMTGFELVHAVRRDPRLQHLPTMMLTARNTRRDQAQMRAAGLSTYLVKPFTVDKCVAVVERLLAERRLVAYKEASRLYISDGAARAAEAAAAAGDVRVARAAEREVAVLFSDLVGFTRLSASLPPRDVVELLNGVFDALCPVLVDEGGDIDKFIGDAIMAVFEEAPDREPAALRAVRGALAMQRALAEYVRSAGVPLQLRIGVNVGTVIRGDIGSKHVRRDFTVIGDVVNRAQRFESNAPPGGVLVGERTWLATRDQVRYEPRPGLHLKNIPEPVNAYVALGLCDAPPEPTS